MSSFYIFSNHHKDVSFNLKRHPEHVFSTMNPLVGKNPLKIATFIRLFCVKQQFFHNYFNFSSEGVNFLASHFTRFNSNPTGKVSVSSIGLNLYQTSFLSHFLSIWCTVVLMLHFFAPTVYRIMCPRAQKMHFLGVFTRRTPPTFVLFCIKVLGARFRIIFPLQFVQNLSLERCGELDL